MASTLLALFLPALPSSAALRAPGLRAFFADDHVHAAVLADGGKLLGVVERADLATAIPAQTLGAQSLRDRR